MDPRNPTDQANHCAIVAPDGTIATTLVWFGDEHFDVADAGYPDHALVKLADCKAPDRDGKIRLAPGAKLKVLPAADKDQTARACCLPTRYVRAFLRVECEVQERALAKAEKREPDAGRVDAQVSALCDEVYERNRAASVVRGRAPAPPSDTEADALVKELVPPEVVAARLLARKAGTDEAVAVAAVRQAKRAGLT